MTKIVRVLQLSKLKHTCPQNAQIPKALQSNPISHFFSPLSETQNSNTFLLNYLIETLNIPKPRVLVISNKYSRVKALEKPQIVSQFSQNVGFSDTHIQVTVNAEPRILFSDI